MSKYSLYYFLFFQSGRHLIIIIPFHSSFYDCMHVRVTSICLYTQNDFNNYTQSSPLISGASADCFESVR